MAIDSIHSRFTKRLTIVWLLFVIASLVHFIHNAEYLPDYPGLPASWTRVGVYAAWGVMTLFGVVGYAIDWLGYRTVGLLAIGCYATLGLASLGHYAVSPLTAHRLGMNATILFEVGAAILVLIEVFRQLGQHESSKKPPA
jgi:hypothetical protein